MIILNTETLVTQFRESAYFVCAGNFTTHILPSALSDKLSVKDFTLYFGSPVLKMVKRFA